MVSAWSLREYPSCEALLTGKLQQFTVADRNPPRSEREPGGKINKSIISDDCDSDLTGLCCCHLRSDGALAVTLANSSCHLIFVAILAVFHCYSQQHLF